MLKGPKTKLMDFEKTPFISPSTRPLSGFINNTPIMLCYALIVLAAYLTGIIMVICGNWQIGAIVIVSQFSLNKMIDLIGKNSKRKRGYFKTDRANAQKLINVEHAYAKLSKGDKTMYRNYLEAAFYGEGTPEKVIDFFDQKLQDAHRIAYETPKPFDEMIEMELDNG